MSTLATRTHGIHGAPAGGHRWHSTLWALQALLALAFGAVGSMKAFTPAAEMAAQAPDLPLALVRFIGAAELAGALGLILPAATRILPWLTPLAALGLGTVVTLASGFHILRGEFFALPVTLGLLAVALVVAWGRMRKAPIAPRD